MSRTHQRAALQRSRRLRDKRIAQKRDRLLAAQMDRDLELRAVGESLSLLGSESEGTLPSFNAVAYTGGPMFPKLAIAWNGPVYVDLAGMEAVDTNPIHRDHDESKPVGHSTSVDNDGTRLTCAGVFSVPNSDTTEIVDSARKGFPWRPSVGVKIVSYTTLQAGQNAVINGRPVTGPALWVKRSVLKEISLVTIPGDDSATIQIKASQSPMDFNAYCQSLGIDPSTAKPELLTALQTAYAESMEPADASPPPAPEPGMDAGSGASPQPTPVTASAPPPEKDPAAMAAAASGNVDLTAQGATPAGVDLQALRRQIAAEHLRASQITTLCAKFGSPTILVDNKSVELAAHAIANGWDADRVELEARRHADLEAARDSRPRGPAIHSRSRDEQQSLEALQAGMLLRAGCNLESENFEKNRWVKRKLPGWLGASINDPVRQRTMEYGEAMSDLSLVDACRLGLRARGHDVPVGRLDMIQAAFSTGTAAALFGATIGAKMLESYAEVDDFSQGWCSEGENPDLEQHNRNRTIAAQSLVYHPVGGEATHTGRTVVTEKAQVYRFSRQMKIDEADVMGDNFGKFKDTPRDFGLAAGRVRPDVVAAVLLSNPTLLQTGRALFNTTDANSVASGKALARATLSEMIAAIRKRIDGDAKLDLPMTHLILPPDLLDTAIQLCFSVVLSNDSGAGEMNPIKEYGITPISEPRLALGMTHPITGVNLSGSTTQYYGVSNKANTIEVTYLQGAGRTPVVRSETLTGGEFGLAIDVRHYVGATPLDWRGFHRFNA